MKQLDSNLSKAWFTGFTLKKGFWYGFTPEGIPVATSGWIKDGKLMLYFKCEDDIWRADPSPREKYEKLLPWEMVEYLDNLEAQK